MISSGLCFPGEIREMEMERKQELEWINAQKIQISVDLVASAKAQLQFLQAVDRNRWLYDGPALQRAIYRYNACWLPLLAKHCESGISEGPLVVPLDCEWVWHCHRLNPVRYKSDCEEFYGRILDSFNIVSSVQGICEKQTEEIWNRLYPDEPYEIDLARALSGSDDVSEKVSGVEKLTKYDLISAVERQTPFFYQVSRSHMSNDIFLEEAVARYKGFLHLIKRNKERSLRQFCVPTYDIDLIWHTHQLHPVAYCKDLNKELGKILEHDDTDSDRTKGKKLDNGFSATTKQWEETFGTRYWKAGGMYRGSAPTPLTDSPSLSDNLNKESAPTHEFQKMIHLPDVKLIEVFLEAIRVENIAEEQKGSLVVLFSKTQPDAFCNGKKKLSISSKSREKQIALFQCESTGELLFELISLSPSNHSVGRTYKTLGTASLSLKKLLDPVSKLAVEKWLELTPVSGNECPKPMRLRVAMSFTIPTPAPYMLRGVECPVTDRNSFYSPTGKVQHAKNRRCVIDETQAEVISLQMREDLTEEKKKQVVGVTKWGETRILAEFTGASWLLMDSQWRLQHQENAAANDHLLELIGCRMVKLIPGRKLEYEPKSCEKKRNEDDFISLVEFSAENPYGIALALLDLKYGLIKATEEWLVFPGMISAFILTDILKKKGFIGFNINGKNMKEVDNYQNGIALEMMPEIAAESGGYGSFCGAACYMGKRGGGCSGPCNGGSSDGCDEYMGNSGACGGCGGGCGGGGGCRGGSCGGGCRGGGCGSRCHNR